MPAMEVDFDDLENGKAFFLNDLRKHTSQGLLGLNPEVGARYNPFQEVVDALEADPNEWVFEERYDEDRVADYLFQNPDEVIEVYQDLARYLEGDLEEPDFDPYELAEGMLEGLDVMYREGVNRPRISAPGA